MTDSATSPTNLGSYLDPPFHSMNQTPVERNRKEHYGKKVTINGPMTPSAKPSPLSTAVTAHAGSLTASATRIKNTNYRTTTPDNWQKDAWEMYDQVGEERFLATTLAGRMGQARFYVGTLGENNDDKPVEVEDKNITEVLTSLGRSTAERSQMIYRLGVNLFVAGEGWLAGVPNSMLKDANRDTDNETLLLDDITWQVLSSEEVSFNRSGTVDLQMGRTYGQPVTLNQNDIFLIRIWRSHPRKWWEADSPTRSSLPVLRELVGLTMHISAQIDSRLAGAGLLVVPQSAKRAFNEAAGVPETSDQDPFTDALISAMLTPIGDRASASAVVPMVVTVQDEAVDKFNHITFSSDLDQEARSLREEAIRRLALGQDAPPELLLGTGSMNHWGAWLVREDVITTHVEPPLALICDALTTEYLWPILLGQGMSEDEVKKYVIWYDVDHLIVRPNRSDSALKLHDAGALSDASLRESSGFNEDDAPKLNSDDLDPAAKRALDMVSESPTLLSNVGLAELVRQIKEIMGEEVGPPILPTGEPATPTEVKDDEVREDRPKPQDNTSPETGNGPSTVPPPQNDGDTPSE